MAQTSQSAGSERDTRFAYEPLFAAHPNVKNVRQDFAGFEFTLPLWISSMTGGAKHAQNLNTLLARACAEFKLGMGLGSCRPLLENRQSLADFDMRPHMPGRPLFANLGIAQVEELQQAKKLDRVHHMVEELRADGLIIHLNPLQEWFQPGGDLLTVAPLETITRFVEGSPYPVIVKEVGHGMGPQSLKALMQLPLWAIEFGAFGGTNFSLLEARRAGTSTSDGLITVGHTAREMVGFVRSLMASGESFKCQRFIISGGVKDSLDGFHLSSQLPGSLFGMAQGVLAHAQNGEAALHAYLENELKQFSMAQAYLRSL
ncbi:MAG: isopentenyl-diphosphate delta-isomerase [Bacteriovoracia bacterium]